MDGQEYLNQISAKNKPVQQSKFNKILTNKFFLIGAGALVFLIIIMIIGAALSSGKGNEKKESIALLLHLNNTSEVIDEYQSSVRSSELRASSSSLKTVLQDTSKKMEEFLTQKYNFKDKDADKKIVEQLTLEKDGLSEELFEAKINGILDRIYAHKMAYEIQLFMAESNQVRKDTKEGVLQSALDTFDSSLENLYDKFNNFSEGQ